MRRVVRFAVTALVVLAASLAVGVGGASASRVDPPGQPDANHCLFFSGVDLNELYGVPEQFHHLACPEGPQRRRVLAPVRYVDRGERVDSVYPPGYVPSRPQPIEDFVAKLTVKVVTDGGTPQQKTYFFSPAAAVRTDISLDQLETRGPALGAGGDDAEDEAAERWRAQLRGHLGAQRPALRRPCDRGRGRLSAGRGASDRRGAADGHHT